MRIIREREVKVAQSEELTQETQVCHYYGVQRGHFIKRNREKIGYFVQWRTLDGETFSRSQRRLVKIKRTLYNVANCKKRKRQNNEYQNCFQKRNRPLATPEIEAEVNDDKGKDNSVSVTAVKKKLVIRS